MRSNRPCLGYYSSKVLSSNNGRSINKQLVNQMTDNIHYTNTCKYILSTKIKTFEIQFVYMLLILYLDIKSHNN